MKSGLDAPSTTFARPLSSHLRVLLVDDDQDTTDAFGLYLAQHGCKVVTAASGDEGIRLAREIQPDVIVLDIVMPVVDGSEVARVLRVGRATAAIPIVFFTGALASKRPWDLRAGDACLTKPCDPDALLAVVRRLGTRAR